MTTWYCVRSNELQHHGIKGQKWGVRRFQNKDGSLTAKGKQRYDKDGNPKQTRKDKLVAKYKSEGLSAENAEYLAARRVKTERIVAAAAAVTVTAATAYVVNKNIKYKADKIIKSGADLQRISANTKMDKALYVSFDKKDNMKYRGLYGMEKGGTRVKLNKMSLKAEDTIKIPSRKKAEDAFMELYKNNSDFKKSVNESMRDMSNQGWYPFKLKDKVSDFVAKDGKVDDKTLRKQIYDAFNFGLTNTRGEAGKAGNMFYDKLKEMGYDAVTDINDQKYSGYRSKAPTIVFNSAKLALDKVEELSQYEIGKDFAKSKKVLQGQATAQMLLESIGPAAVAGIGYGGFAAGTINASVMKYRKDHPNTTKTDKEIYEMLMKGEK